MVVTLLLPLLLLLWLGPLPTFSSPALPPTEQELFRRSLRFLTSIPGTVTFTREDQLLFARVQGNKLYVYDVQWVATQSAIVLLVSERIVKDSRPPNIGAARNISYFFPDVNVTAFSALPGQAILNYLVACHDLPKSNGTTELHAPDSQVMSTLYCPMPPGFTSRITNTQNAYTMIYAEFRRMAVEIPVAAATASIYFRNTVRKNPPPIDQPKSQLSICVTGIFSLSFPYVREVVEHYSQLGVDHLYISYSGNMVDQAGSSTEVILREYRELESLLWDYISENKVSVIFAPSTHPEIEPDYIDAYGKLPFLQSCLWHSKSFDNYTGAFDIDELVIVNGTNKNFKEAISNYIANVPHELPNCFFCLDKMELCPAVGNSPLLSVRFPLREALHDGPTYGKSIALTQRAKTMGIHTHGSCQPVLPMEVKDFEKGGFWASEGKLGIYHEALHHISRNLSAIPYNFFVLHVTHMYALREEMHHCVNGSAPNEYSLLRSIEVAMLTRCLKNFVFEWKWRIAQYCYETFTFADYLSLL